MWKLIVLIIYDSIFCEPKVLISFNAQRKMLYRKFLSSIYFNLKLMLSDSASYFTKILNNDFNNNNWNRVYRWRFLKIIVLVFLNI